MMNVLIVDTQPVYREGLAIILRQHFSQWRITTANSVYDDASILKNSEIKIDLLLLSINRQSENDGYPLEEILKDVVDMEVIVLSSAVDTLCLKKMLDQGVRGIIPKFYSIEEMLSAIRECWKGRTHIPTEVKKVISQCLAQNEAVHLLRLTKRQLQVLELIEKRMTNEEIAEKLFVSLATIKTHINKIYSALEVGGRRECVQRSYDLGVLSRSA